MSVRVVLHMDPKTKNRFKMNFVVHYFLFGMLFDLANKVEEGCGEGCFAFRVLNVCLLAT